MSKSSARHSKTGVDNRKIATKVAAKRAAHREAQDARQRANMERINKLGIELDGDSPSRALRRYERDTSVAGMKAAQAAFYKSLDREDLEREALERKPAETLLIEIFSEGA